MSDDHQFNPTRIFLYLLLYTVLEVAWGMFFPGPRWALWGGLLICAYLKGHLIFTWFMHMKFEGWIVKGLVAPTIPLVAILIFANMPDTSLNDDMLYPIGSQLDVELKYANEYQAEDEEGNLLFDDHGDPVMLTMGRTLLDDEGNPVLDENGQPVTIFEKRLVSHGKVSTMADKSAPKAITKQEQEAIRGH